MRSRGVFWVAANSLGDEYGGIGNKRCTREDPRPTRQRVSISPAAAARRRVLGASLLLLAASEKSSYGSRDPRSVERPKCGVPPHGR